MQAKIRLYTHIPEYIEAFMYKEIYKSKQNDVCIDLKLVYISKCLYIWLYMAIYTHICILLAPKRCMRFIPSMLTPKKLFCATPS